MQPPKLFRKRLIPNECILLKEDRILELNEDEIITSWKALKPRKDLSHGFSLYLLKEGIKISRFLGHEGQFLYWYCDIVDTVYVPEENTYIFKDLLIDVKVFPDGEYRILDLDELSLAFSQNLVTVNELLYAIGRLDCLLKKIYDGSFEKFENRLLPFSDQ
ncbi:MAG: DUF402 domain-containing protein [Parasporobacterium sp.]|nr:DUF402 domain-containing protein [Parasporobacterium sp.]